LVYFDGSSKTTGVKLDKIAANMVILITVALIGILLRYFIATSYPKTCGTFRAKGIINSIPLPSSTIKKPRSV